MTDSLIYLDHAATTAVDPQVVEAMMPYFSHSYGNPSSIHQQGRLALQALDDARDTVATIVGASAKEIVFTGGGSEANNLALKGVAFAQQRRGRGQHMITSAIEHHAVLHALEYLETFGFTTTILPVNADGIVSPDDLLTAIRPDTILVSVMYANNEIGTIQPIAELGKICRARNIPFHTDAIQAAGSLPLDVDELNVDLLTLTAHKFYGPKGVGMLYIRRGTTLLPQINGGGQERRRRAGTENVAGIVGLAKALALAEERRPSYVRHCTMLRDRLIAGMIDALPTTQLNGDPYQRLPNNANLAFDCIESESLLLLLDQHGIAASSGSACSSGAIEPSHVLMALGKTPEEANSSVRFTVGRTTTAADIDHVIAVVPDLVNRLRAVEPCAHAVA